MNKNIKNIFKNSAALYFIQIANMILPLATAPYLTRVLGIDVYGTFAFTIAIVNTACVVTDFGFNLWATAKVSKCKSDIGKINKIYGAITFIKILLMLVCVALLIIFLKIFENKQLSDSEIYWIIFSMGAITFQQLWLFGGLENMLKITLIILLSRLLYAVMVFVSVNGSSDLNLLVFIYGASNLFIAVSGGVILFKIGYYPCRVSMRYWKSVFKSAAPFFISRLAVTAYTSAGALFLGMTSTNRNVAIYSIAEQLYKGAQGLLSPLPQVMYPFMVRTKNYLALKKVIVISTLLALTGCFMTILIGEKIIVWMFGSEYIESFEVLKIFLVAVILGAPSVLLGYPMLGALGKLKLANRSVIYGGLIQILLFLICVFFELNGPIFVAITILLSEFFVLTIRFFWVKKYSA